MKSILIIYNEIPREFFNGGNIRVFDLIKELSKSNKVTILTFFPDKKDKEYLKKLENFCEVILVPKSIMFFLNRNLLKFSRYILNDVFIFIKKLNPFIPKVVKDHKRQNFFLKNKLKDILKERDFDYIQVENLCTAPVLEGIKTNSKKIIDFMEICSYLKNSSKERFLIRKYERKISKVYDIAICCSEVDKKRLSELGYCNVFVVPNGVDFIHFKFTKKKPLKNKSEKSLLFVGGLYHKQNFEAVKYFFKKIYPLLNKDIQINIIGKCDKSKFIDEKGFENVNFLGFVKDIRSYFENSIFICPLLDGGGTRLKILTAFSLGSPVVSTSKGAEGIECFNGGNILLANSPEAFVKNINNLLENPTLYKKIRTNALKLVKEKYLWGSIVKNYNSFLKNITT